MTRNSRIQQTILKPLKTAFVLLFVSFGLVMAQEPAASPIRVACIGDSITAGFGIPQGVLNYPQRLQEKLGEGYLVKNFGASGRTFLKDAAPPSYWKSKEWEAAQVFQPQMAIILLGTNDSKPKNFEKIENLSADAADMIRILRELPSKPLVLLGLPAPVYKTNFGITEENMVPIRAQLKAVAEKENVPLIDFSAALSGHASWFPDGVHPNGEGVEALAEAALEAIRANDKK